MATKSLGQLDYPVWKLESFNGSSRTVLLKLETGGRSIRIKIGVSNACTLVDIAREIATKQSEYAQGEVGLAERLRRYTGMNS